MEKLTTNNLLKKKKNLTSQQTTVVETNLASTNIENSTKIPDKK